MIAPWRRLRCWLLGHRMVWMHRVRQNEAGQPLEPVLSSCRRCGRWQIRLYEVARERVQ